MSGLLPGTENRTANPVSTLPLVRLLWIIVHTIVGTVAGSLSGRHYHFYIRADGHVVQRQRYDRRAAASVEANPYSIAITLEDMGPAFGPWSGNNVPAATRAQIDSLVRVVALLCARTGLPPDVALSSCLNSGRGLRWHRLGIDGNFPGGIFRGRIPGCQRWSTARGKGCPGDRRIRQIHDEVIPRVRAVLGKTASQSASTPAPIPVIPEDDMILMFRTAGRPWRAVVGGKLVGFKSDTDRKALEEAAGRAKVPVVKTSCSEEQYEFYSDTFRYSRAVLADLDS